MKLHAWGRRLLYAALLFAPQCGGAQTPATVNITTPTACIASPDGTALAKGTLTVIAPGQTGQAAPFSSSTGIVLAESVTRPIVDGQIVGSLALPNPAVTSPANIGYTFTIHDTTQVTSSRFANVAITPDGSGNWSLCNLQAGSYQTAFPTVFTGGGSFNGGSIALATTFGSTVTLHADPAANLQAATKQYVDNHAVNWAIPGSIGSTTPNSVAATTVTAQSVQTTGTNAPSQIVLTPNGQSPTTATNSITLAPPASVPTPYVFNPPTNVTDATSSPLPMQCQFFAAVAGPPAVAAHITCTLAAVSGGLGNGLSTGVNGGTYSCLTFNGTCVNGNYLGLVADTSGGDHSQYYNVPAGGSYNFEIAGAGAAVIATGSDPTGSCSGHYFYNNATTGHVSYCNGSTWGLQGSSGLGNGLSTGQNSGSYSCLTFNGTCANGSYLGLVADTSGTNPSLYENVPAGGTYTFEIGGVGTVQFSPSSAPSGSCSGTYFVFSSSDGHITYCNGSNYVSKL